MAIIDFLFQALAGYSDLFRIDYYHKISTLEMRCKGWFMLPTQNLRNLRCQSAQDLAFGIDNIPFRVQFSGFGAVCLLHCS